MILLASLASPSCRPFRRPSSINAWMVDDSAHGRDSSKTVLDQFPGKTQARHDGGRCPQLADLGRDGCRVNPLLQTLDDDRNLVQLPGTQGRQG